MTMSTVPEYPPTIGVTSTYAPPTTLTDRAFVIVGAGTLGRRIALMWLTRGGVVHLISRSQSTLDSARTYIDSHLPDVIRTHVPTGAPGRLKLFTSLPLGLETAWIVVESIPEMLQSKIDILGQLDGLLPPDVILATNSSSFMASEVWDKVVRRDRLINTHYYIPPDLRALEIMPTPLTDGRIIDLLMEESAKHGLIPFHVRKPSVGLIANRIWAAIKRESLLVLSESVSTPEEIDSILRNTFGLEPFRMMDRVGLDVVRDIEAHYLDVREDVVNSDALRVLDGYVRDGRLGSKTGRGFYEYPKESG